MEVYALYDKNRFLLMGLGSLFVAEIVALCCLLANVTPRLTYNDECYVTSSPPNFQYYWYVPQRVSYSPLADARRSRDVGPSLSRLRRCSSS